MSKNTSRNEESKVSVSSPSQGSVAGKTKANEEDSTSPEFIYGGPFIKVEKDAKFLNTATPFNVQLQGTFKKYVKTNTNCEIQNKIESAGRPIR